MIYTRFGSPVTIIAVQPRREGFVKCQRSDGSLVADGAWIPISELRADGGAKEIDEVVQRMKGTHAAK